MKKGEWILATLALAGLVVMAVPVFVPFSGFGFHVFATGCILFIGGYSAGFWVYDWFIL